MPSHTEIQTKFLSAAASGRVNGLFKKDTTDETNSMVSILCHNPKEITPDIKNEAVELSVFKPKSLSFLLTNFLGDITPKTLVKTLELLNTAYSGKPELQEPNRHSGIEHYTDYGSAKSILTDAIIKKDEAMGRSTKLKRDAIGNAPVGSEEYMQFSDRCSTKDLAMRELKETFTERLNSQRDSSEHSR